MANHFSSLRRYHIFCESETFEKFNQHCGNPTFLFYFFAYNLPHWVGNYYDQSWSYFYNWNANIPYYFQQLYNCTVDPGSLILVK